MTHRSQDHTTPSATTGVRRRIHLDLVDQLGRAVDLTAGFHFDVADPYAVSLTFFTDGPEVTWSFARDLLAVGLSEAIGSGDVHVRPLDGQDRPVTVIELRSPGGEAVLQAPTAEVEAFVAATMALVPAGAETAHLDLDALVDDLLAA